MIVQLQAGTSWYIGNIMHSGWYRINYDDTNWNALIQQLNTDASLIHAVHKAQLLDDSFNLGRAEIVPQTLFMDITKYLATETDPLPFVPAFTGLNFMTPFVEDDLNTLINFKVNFISYFNSFALLSTILFHYFRSIIPILLPLPTQNTDGSCRY